MRPTLSRGSQEFFKCANFSPGSAMAHCIVPFACSCDVVAGEDSTLHWIEPEAGRVEESL